MNGVDWIELVGWIASALTVASYAVNTMLALRVLAIASSVAFVLYALFLQLWPLLAMELLLLPINMLRLWQLIALRRKVGRADMEASDFSVIRTYGTARRVAAGTLVFAKGDSVCQLYFLAEGSVRIEEFDIDLQAGDIFGEIAFFTDAAVRTASARCTRDARIYELDAKGFMRLQFEDPSFGMSVMRTITHRLARNAGIPWAPGPEQP
ncbi:cyclic nucleotide-binding domain-containing protein [uncultured Roseobacter sp.]|uniref:Crp/Fnr family transcriptional regulator n=1 Tax=uncultured Roseobacter sp. TaxID=114847 RepID=UPI0026257DA3|nr:cyclic nucleotide-binding domain-containing protein [uncultured Roseobacter sp.]